MVTDRVRLSDRRLATEPVPEWDPGCGTDLRPPSPGPGRGGLELLFRVEYALGRVGSFSDATDAARLSVRDLGRLAPLAIDDDEDGGGSPFRSGIMATGDAVRMGNGIIMATGEAVLSGIIGGTEDIEDDIEEGISGIEHTSISFSSSSFPLFSSGLPDWEEVTNVRDRRMTEGEEEP